MHCPGCGGPLQPEDADCPHCGLRIPAQPQADSGPGCAILLVLLILGFAALVGAPLILLRMLFGGF